MRTTAVLESSAGKVAAGSGRDGLNPVQRAMAEKVGAKASREKGVGTHAETNTIKDATAAGGRPTAIGIGGPPSRVICPTCKGAIESSGGVVTGPRTAIWP